MTHTTLGCLLDRTTGRSSRRGLCAGLAAAFALGFVGCATDSSGVGQAEGSRVSTGRATPAPDTGPLVQKGAAGERVAPSGLKLERSRSLESQAEVTASAGDEGRGGVSGELIERGRASWYGRRFQGRPTASGEPFDMHQLTAAHKTLPFGSMVRVRSLSNGREVVVRINDRGPFTEGRVIDLSQAAMKALGLRTRGVVRVALLRE